ncbi:MAG: hypothetical protein K8T89_15790 [Planctomycetes bacterium]|nr:hypothetical protein [Planctomycetota bacterium]
MNKTLILLIALTLGTPHIAQAAEKLPEPLPHQQQLRKFMSTLKAEDFEPIHKDLKVVPFEGDADELFRTYILALQPPSVGRKRNYSSVMIKSSLFTLEAIEGPKAIMRPPAHPEPLVDLSAWNYPGNPYYGSKPLRMRAFVLVALDMIMLDDLLEKADPETKPTQNQLLGAVARFAYTYPGIRDVIPADVRTAYMTGLKRLVRRALEHGPSTAGPKGTGMYTWAAPALFLSAKILDDAEISKQVTAYTRTIFTGDGYFKAAGYFPNGGTLDSFNGISTYFAVWGAQATDAPFAREAIAKVYNLRSHLTLPEPDGVLVGPSHMASLTSAESAHEQWNWPMRTWGAALIADEAACLAKMPTEAELQNAPAAVVAEINMQIRELSWAAGGMDPSPWKFQPAGTLVNFAYQYYPKGYYARRLALEKAGTLAKLPVLREGSYVRNFNDEFVVAKAPTHAAVIHTGPIADPASQRPAYGFGGGALSAFWTRETGSVILGRGVGAFSPQYKKTLEEWRSLPSHAVTGITADGTVFTSAHIVKPTTTIKTDDKGYTVTAQGTIPAFRHDPAQKLSSKIEYTRKFEPTPAGIRITTSFKDDGKDKIAEVYEVLPIHLRDSGSQPKAILTLIEIDSDGKWIPATEAFADKVSKVRLTRFGVSVVITFDRPCRVKLAPPWSDTYQTRSACRNLLIDMLQPGDTRTISYRIEASVP